MEQIYEVLQVEKDVTKLWIVCLLLWAGFSAVALVAHKLIAHYYLRLASFTQNDWDNKIAETTSKPIQFLLLTVAAIAAINISKLPLEDNQWLLTVLKGMAIFFMFWSIERIVYTLIQAGILLRQISKSSRLLISLVIRATIFAIAFMMILDAAGISITPLLASLGVGSVAVALALQDTLSNLFSGFYLLADKPFEVGNFVEIDQGIQGYVTKVGWRSTHIRQLTNNTIVVPNSKVASATLINYDLTDRQSGMLIPCGVAYESDLEKVEKVCLQVANELSASASYGVKDFEPKVRFNEFGDSSINFNVVIRVDKYDNHFELRHEFIKRLHKAFNENGIEIPFPQRVMTFKTPLHMRELQMPDRSDTAKP